MEASTDEIHAQYLCGLVGVRVAELMEEIDRAESSVETAVEHHKIVKKLIAVHPTCKSLFYMQLTGFSSSFFAL